MKTLYRLNWIVILRKLQGGFLGESASQNARQNISLVRGKRSRSVELEEEANKIRQLGLGKFYTMLRFN